MITRRATFALISAALLMAPLATSAVATTTGEIPYSAAAFAAAQAAGKSILVEIHAGWCPTCKAQSAVLNQLLQKPAMKNLAVFRVDFDDQKPVVAGFGAKTQSTLIVFHGKSEAGRAVGITGEGDIDALLTKAL